jgi:lipopolysaccharide transport system ATP-binding protein
MTGRENIYLNGAILGMRRYEITRKLDEIIAFSGVERYIDTPVKRYSSGMYVRLAFAVAAHLESEILIVDEVLAVGDAEFQKKCLGKMGDVSKGEGRTVLFVSHNMVAIQNLCNKGILLNNGNIKSDGEIQKVLSNYLSINQYSVLPNNSKEIFLSNLKATSKNDNYKPIITGQNAIIELEISSLIDKDGIFIGIGINDLYGNRLITPFSKHTNKSYSIKKGINKIICEILSFPLKPATYFLEIYVGTETEIYDYYDKGLTIDIEMIGNNNLTYVLDNTQGNYIINQIWK